MDVIGFEIEQRESKKTGKKYYVFNAITKDNNKFFIKFVNKL